MIIARVIIAGFKHPPSTSKKSELAGNLIDALRFKLNIRLKGIIF
jgi:hypothetical protein